MFVRFAPRLPKDQTLLSHIIAYKNHLQDSQTIIVESDIPWTLGLQVQPGFFDKNLNYSEDHLPNWIISTEGEVQRVMNHLHSSFAGSVSRAIYGGHKRKRFSRRFSKRY